jgi:hypothetical protein
MNIIFCSLWQDSTMMFRNTQVDVLVYSSRNSRNQNGLGALRRHVSGAELRGLFV